MTQAQASAVLTASRSTNKLAKVWEVQDCKSVDALLKASHTDWDIESEDAGVSGDRLVHSGGYKALIRPDTQTVLSYVSRRYSVNNHRQQLQWLDGLIQDGALQPTSVSVWDNGAVLAYQLRCTDLDVVISGRDVVSPLLTLAFAYGFPLADTAFFADFRWFCKNQLGQVAKLSQGHRVTHRGDVENKYVDVLHSRLGELKGELSGHYQQLRGLMAKPVNSAKSLADYFGAAVGMKQTIIDAAFVEPEAKTGPAKQLQEILECYQVDDAGAEGTYWQAFNAVTRYQTHHHGRNEATRQRANLLGSGQAVMSRALELAVAA